ncbi:pyruvate kinase [Aeoliella sp. ICT_H6.2]|uniref:Pyruvate kinase n=2 Tax=Aeoliella straminimaris TaxID=2954799 RepID=A0A9X2FCJ5_9BACT|nr:pyruvate kinase [Aeoliella straminimaris]
MSKDSMTSQPQDIRERSYTKIVATVGPASDTKERITELVCAGVDVFRLNMAHGGPEEQQPKVDIIRQVSDELNQPVAVLVDLAGPKIRLGEVADGCIHCERDDEYTFVDGDESEDPRELTSTYEPLTTELSKGDSVMLADGTVIMRVVDVKPGRVRAIVTQPGDVRSRQGINLPGVKLSAPAISVTDHMHAIWAAKAKVDFVSLSFVRAPDEVKALKDILKSAGSQADVIAKIEKREALDRLEDIVAVSDAVMVARGDLGVEINVAEMPVEQKRIIRVCHRYEKPVIIATQMLESMHQSTRPTRAEVTDVANAVLDGADACMLSGETAIGNHPARAVAMMNSIARATETAIPTMMWRAPDREEYATRHDVTRAVVSGAGLMANELQAKTIVVASHSGNTALALSQHRNLVPTIGVSTKESTLRKMCLYWGVTPLRGAPACDMQQLIRHADEWACSICNAKRGDRIVIVGGSHLAAGPDGDQMASGVHDVVIVHEVEGA